MRPRPEPRVLSWLDVQPQTDLYIPAIAKAEIEYGIAVLPDGQRKQALQQSAELLLKAFERRCLSLDCLAASFYAEILALAKQRGRAISIEDAQIAGIARANGGILATRNIKDFDGVDGLRLVDPWAA